MCLYGVKKLNKKIVVLITAVTVAALVMACISYYFLTRPEKQRMYQIGPVPYDNASYVAYAAPEGNVTQNFNVTLPLLRIGPSECYSNSSTGGSSVNQVIAPTNPEGGSYHFCGIDYYIPTNLSIFPHFHFRGYLNVANAKGCSWYYYGIYFSGAYIGAFAMGYIVNYRIQNQQVVNEASLIWIVRRGDTQNGTIMQNIPFDTTLEIDIFNYDPNYYNFLVAVWWSQNGAQKYVFKDINMIEYNLMDFYMAGASTNSGEAHLGSTFSGVYIYYYPLYDQLAYGEERYDFQATFYTDAPITGTGYKQRAAWRGYRIINFKMQVWPYWPCSSWTVIGGYQSGGPGALALLN